MKVAQCPTEKRERGQTTLDFAFGIGIFLLAVVFVVLFIPDLLAPFNTPSEGGEKMQAERTADYLVAHVLVAEQETAHPTTLDPTCTDAFFSSSTSPPSRCGFSIELYASGELDPTALGLKSSTRLRIQLQALSSAEETSVGVSRPPSQNTQEWSRLVSVSGQRYILQVQVW